jgi:catechol 2,3-dioxygenase-like lactoylglutathione lyase family enzyme
LTLAVAILAALVAQASPAAILPEECPRVSLTYRGGLGFEGDSGVVFAAWDSGAVVRAVRFDAPDKAHVVGTVAAGDLAALVDAVAKSAFWDGDVHLAVDAGQHTLELRRPDGSRLGRSQTRDQRLSPALEAIRRRAFGLALTGTQPVIARIDESRWRCPKTTWKDE